MWAELAVNEKEHAGIQMGIVRWIQGHLDNNISLSLSHFLLWVGIVTICTGEGGQTLEP